MRFAMLVINNLDENGYLTLKGVPKVEPGKEKEKREHKAAEHRERDHRGEHRGEHGADAVGEGYDSEHVRRKSEPAPPPTQTDASAQITLTVADLAREAGLDPDDAEEVLKLIQSLDPVGVASRDLRECLLVQAENFGYDKDDVVWQVIDRHLANVEKRNFSAIARDLKCELEDVYESAKLISTLEPRPGRNFTTEDPPYITPDVYVHKVGDDYVVTTNDDGLPKLKINVEQAHALMKDPKAKEFVQSKLASARWFVRSLDQRHKTIVKVTQCIVEKQRDFFEKGIEHLKPMILRDVAETVGMHESTISRVTTNKYVHTPRGIFELKYFFNSSIRRMADEDIASESVKQAIKKIIGEEDPKNPLSDEQIVKKLEGQKILIARRTVAKYREMLGILSSAKRKQYF
jgi:RNA polymerase sigma-54 factor